MSLRLISSDELLASAGGTLDWVLYPLAVRGSSIMLYARQGAGKSSLCMQLAHSLITGTPWLGFDVRARGPVIYLQVDMSEQEMLKLVQRSESEGFAMHGQLFISSAEPGEESIAFDILRDEDVEALRALCEQVQPIAVIVDTIHDSYEHQDKYKDVNALARRVHRRFRAAIGNAVLVFLNHERKQAPVKFRGSAPAGEESDDDSFMGGQAWEGVVSSSLKLQRLKGRSAKLTLKKVRLEDKPFESLKLSVSTHGFFQPALERNYKQLLLSWPDCLPYTDRVAESAKLRSKADVFRRIAEISGEKYDTVRQHAHRHVDQESAWKKYVSDGEESA